MTTYRLTRSLAAAAVAVAALVAAGAAQAGRSADVFWSVGVSSPGVQLGVSNAQPMLIQQPAYIESYPVYVQPRPVYFAPSPVVYVRPAPIFYGPPQYVGWERPGHGWGWRRHGHHGHDRGDD